MKKYIYGIGQEHNKSISMLIRQGYDGIVLGKNDVSALRVARDAGLETWLCFGAHWVPDPMATEHCALDAQGKRAPWFGSACPNAATVNARNLEEAVQVAREAKVTGMIVDGARFSSFASQEGIYNYFGCFCDRCTKKMERLGMDAQGLQAAVTDLMGYLRGEPVPQQDARFRMAVADMLEFRRKCVREYMDTFAAQAHGAGMKAGAFVFSPSLWNFVGQEAQGLQCLDMVAPMIYRDYPHSIGTACLGHEWAAFQKLVSDTGRPPCDIAHSIFQTEIPKDNPLDGFPPKYVGEEVNRARKALSQEITLLPIIQTEDTLLEQTRKYVLDNGADGCGEFMFQQKSWDEEVSKYV